MRVCLPFSSFVCLSSVSIQYLFHVGPYKQDKKQNKTNKSKQPPPTTTATTIKKQKKYKTKETKSFTERHKITSLPIESIARAEYDIVKINKQTG